MIKRNSKADKNKKIIIDDEKKINKIDEEEEDIHKMIILTLTYT